MGLRDYTAILEQVRQARPQLLVLLNYGGDTYCLLRQARLLGLLEEMRVLVERAA